MAQESGLLIALSRLYGVVNWLWKTRMWNEQQRRRFQDLRNRNDQLTELERAELDGLLQDFDANEAKHLATATERLRQEREVIEGQNRSIEALVRRKETLLTRLHLVLTEAERERQAIESELIAILGPEQSTSNNP